MWLVSIDASLLEQKKAFSQEKSSTLTGLVWDTNMVAALLFWETNMAAVSSCENIYTTDSSPVAFKPLFGDSVELQMYWWLLM